MEQKDRNMPNQGDTGSEDRNTLEWWVALFSGLIVTAMIGFLILQGIGAARDAPTSQPVPFAQVVQIAPISSGYRVEISAGNSGETTAASVRFRATLQRNGRPVETVEVVFDYLPGNSERSGAVIFQQDPRLFDLVITPESYVAP